jgi:hypothetical protein
MVVSDGPAGDFPFHPVDFPSVSSPYASTLSESSELREAVFAMRDNKGNEFFSAKFQVRYAAMRS